MNHISIDIGNSDVVIGIYSIKGWETHRIPVLSFMDQSDKQTFMDITSGWQVESVAVSTVVPEATDMILNWVRKDYHASPYLINHESYHFIKTNTSNPEEIGTDLMANAEAALHQTNNNSLVIDFGTALTFTAVSSEGKIKGVSISPGVGTALKSLTANASQLFEVPLEFPDSVFGKDTVQAIQSGILYGYSGLIDGMINRIKKEWMEEFSVVATGGLVSKMKLNHSKFDIIDPYLTLKGIHLIYQANHSED